MRAVDVLHHDVRAWRCRRRRPRRCRRPRRSDGWFSDAADWASRRNRAWKVGSRARSARSVLTATVAAEPDVVGEVDLGHATTAETAPRARNGHRAVRGLRRHRHLSGRLLSASSNLCPVRRPGPASAGRRASNSSPRAASVRGHTCHGTGRRSASTASNSATGSDSSARVRTGPGTGRSVVGLVHRRGCPGWTADLPFDPWLSRALGGRVSRCPGRCRRGGGEHEDDHHGGGDRRRAARSGLPAAVAARRSWLSRRCPSRDRADHAGASASETGRVSVAGRLGRPPAARRALGFAGRPRAAPAGGRRGPWRSWRMTRARTARGCPWGAAGGSSRDVHQRDAAGCPGERRHGRSGTRRRRCRGSRRRWPGVTDSPLACSGEM